MKMETTFATEASQNYAETMSASLELSESIGRAARAGLELARLDWPGNILTAASLADSVASNAALLLRLATVAKVAATCPT